MPCEERADRGFTLVEILIAIVLVGILSAVVVVGISNLTSKGSSAACATSLDAANVGAAVHYAQAGRFPDTLEQMTSAQPPSLVMPSGVSLNSSDEGGAAAGTLAKGSGWTLTITPGTNGAAPTFRCTATGSASSIERHGTAACPGTYTGWVGEYYGNRSLDGAAAMCRDDAAVNFSWEYGAPGGALLSNDFSVRWTRSVTFPAGTTTFTVTSDDGVRLFVDGVVLLDFWNDQDVFARRVPTTLTAGQHTVVLEYYEGGGIADAELSWA